MEWQNIKQTIILRFVKRNFQAKSVKSNRLFLFFMFNPCYNVGRNQENTQVHLARSYKWK